MSDWQNQWGATRVTGEGAFSDVITAELTPMCQRDFAYGGHDDEVYEYTFGTGSITYENSMAVLATGASAGGTAFMRTDRAVRYRPGQGALFRFTALFSAPVAGVSMTAGAYGGSENGLFVGYNYADTGGPGGTPRFGFCRQHDGLRDVHSLQITAAASGAETLTVTLNGTATNVSLTAGTVAENAQEVAATSFSGWVAEASGDTVYFLANNVGARSGAYSASSTGTATASFTQKLAGQATTEEWVYSSSFNIDRLDGSGVSGFELDPTKGNVYQIRMQYLGFGAIDFGVEDPQSGRFIVAHRYRYANANTVPSSSNPIYQIGGAVSNVTGASNSTVSIGSVAGFVEGTFAVLGPSHGQTAEGNVSAETPVLSIRCNQIFSDGISRVNLRDILPTFLSVSGSGSNKPIRAKLVLSGTLTDPLWNFYAATHSFVSYDTSATGISGGDVIFETSFSSGSGVAIDLTGIKISVRPGTRSVLSVVVEPTGTAADYVASLAWREDS